MTHQSDQYFIDKTLEGDINAFAILVDRYKNLVFTLSIRMMKHSEDAEEVAQDVMVRAFQKLSSFQGKSKFSTWLYRITYNMCLDTLSRKQKQPTYHASAINEEITGAQMASVIDILEAEDVRQHLELCIAQLPEEEAFLVTLYYLQEQQLEEIALITGYTKNNVKVKLFRSRKKLYSIMANQLPNEIRTGYE